MTDYSDAPGSGKMMTVRVRKLLSELVAELDKQGPSDWVRPRDCDLVREVRGRLFALQLDISENQLDEMLIAAQAHLFGLSLDDGFNAMNVADLDVEGMGEELGDMHSDWREPREEV